MSGMMMVPAFGADEGNYYEGAYLGEAVDDGFEGEGDDDDGFEGDGEGEIVFGADGRAYVEVGRGFRRGGPRLRRCRQERHELAEQQGGEAEVGYASPRRVTRIENRISRNQSRLQRVAPPRPVAAKKVVPVRAFTLNLQLGGAGATTGEISTKHQLQADTYLDTLVFNDSSSGASIMRIEVGDMVLWKSETDAGIPCSAFTTAGVQPFRLNGTKILKGSILEVRGKIAADNDKINAMFMGKKAVENYNCG
jgi:hypothetical protein